jgi:hypothetical protein
MRAVREIWEGRGADELLTSFLSRQNEGKNGGFIAGKLSLWGALFSFKARGGLALEPGMKVLAKCRQGRAKKGACGNRQGFTLRIN